MANFTFILPVRRFYLSFTEEIFKLGKILFSVRRESKTVSRAAYLDKALPRGASRIILLAHFTGHEVVSVPVEEYHGQTAVFHRFDGGRRFNIESAEQHGAKAYHGV